MVEAIDSAEARKRAKEVKEHWLDRIVSGEVSLEDLLDYSNGGDREASYVAAIRLSTILENMPGWSESAAVSVLLKDGFKQSDTVKTLRSFKNKAAKFKNIFELPAPSFASTRPEMPRGWPWQGKLADLVRVTGKEIPALQVEGFGTESTKKIGERRTRPVMAVPELRANPNTGEIIDPEPFWESKPADIPEQPPEPSINESDIAALFGEDENSVSAAPQISEVDENDIEAFLS